MFLEIRFIGSFPISSARFSEFDGENVILFKIKVFGGNILKTIYKVYDVT